MLPLKRVAICLYRYRMEQGLSEGSLRNSHRETHAVRRKPAPAKLQQRASALVESCSQDLILRQRLDPDRVEMPLKKGGFYVLGNEGKADPGFLVLMAGEPAVYLQTRRGKNGSYTTASTLRLRVSNLIDNTVLIATLDDVMHSLRLEDVWKWNGSCVTDKPYSGRRIFLKEFVEKHWIPDARLLGGIFTTVAAPISMEEFAVKQDWSQMHSLEFVPEQAGRRRMILFLEIQQKAATGPAAEKHLRGAIQQPQAAPRPPPRPVAPQSVLEPVSKPFAQPVAQLQVAKLREARAVPVDKMPDIYDLYDREGLPISRASVQQFSLSLKLREAGESWVKARWVAEFGGYEIVEILDNQ